MIIALFAFGLWQWYRNYRRLGQEIKAAQDLKARKNLLLDADTIGLSLGPASNWLAGRLIKLMVAQNGLAFARPADTLDPVLDEVQRINASARAVPNLLLLFGLIGTVVGLMFTLGSLGPQIQESINTGAPAAVARSLGQTLHEMSAAFAGTLWGVGLAFVLQALNALAATRAGQLSGALDELSLHYAPMVYPAGSEKQLQSLQDLVRRSEEFLSETQQAIAQTSADFSKVLLDAGQAIQGSLVTLQSTSKDISEALKVASSDVKLSSERLNTAVESMQRHRQDYRSIYTQFNEMFERSMRKLSDHSDSELREIRELQSAFGHTGAQIVQEIFRTGEQLNRVSTDLAASQAAYIAGTETVGTSLKQGFDTLHERLDGTLSRYTSEVNMVSAHLTGLGDSLQASSSATATLERTLRAKDAAELTRARDQAQREGQLTSSVVNLNEQLHLLVPLIQSLKDPGPWEGQLLGAVEALVKTSATGQSQQEQGWRALGEHLGSQNEQLRKESGALHREMQQANTLLLGVLDQLSSITDQAPAQQAQAAQATEAALRGQAAAEEIRALLTQLPSQLGTDSLLRAQDSLQVTLDRLSQALEGAMGPAMVDGPAA
ncbi:hypothetical protein [Deinococcus aquaedulcis]|uniref:hypothetical protein n=1 Tax=Deinococcus aquaedulcis TaxID=2840455 RepID=UPI001C828161|nr:hypothetical protein [Deinococcus aquaedulcis]